MAVAPHVVRVRGWPDPRADERWGAGGEWRPCTPVLRLLAPRDAWPDGPALPGPRPAFGSPEATAARREALLAFRATVPEEVAALVEPFASHQFALLDLLARRSEARDLARANPVLAYAVANNHEFRPLRWPTPAEQAAWVLDRRQRQLARWLGFPGTEATVKLLRKIEPAAANPSSLRMLAGVMRAEPETVQWLSHLPRLGPDLLWLVCRGPMRSVVAPSFLRELAAGAQGDVQGWLVDAMRHWRAFGGREGAPPPRFDSLRQLRDHAAVARAAAEWRRNAVERRRRIREAYRRSSFPEGNADIVRLRTARDLDEEGAVQRNCVASYWRRARADALAVYRVLRPERATLSVRRGELGYEIGELEAAHCRPVRPETRAAVDAWLAESLADLYRRATA